jgi:DNA mismatch endonuclease (patch repair protein)
VFVDGDFWHGKTWRMRKAKLAQGHNADYWISKIERNMERDRERTRELSAAGWLVLRVWESEIHADLDRVVRRVESALRRR